MDKLTRTTKHLLNGLDRIGLTDRQRKKELDLPDGCHLSAQQLEAKKWDKTLSAIGKARYITTFPVDGQNLEDRLDYVQTTLKIVEHELLDGSCGEEVALVISLSGIKVCRQTGESVLMTHAIHRISYCSCQPEMSCFLFLARASKSDADKVSCNVFKTDTPSEAEELNTYCGTAFRMAYALLRSQDPVDPGSHQSFHEVIAQQLEVQRKQQQEEASKQKQVLQSQFSRISTTHIEDELRDLKERRQREHEKLEQETVQGKLPHPPIPASTRRSYGSPVVLLKESIDLQYQQKQAGALPGQRTSDIVLARSTSSRSSGRYQNELSSSQSASGQLANATSCQFAVSRPALHHCQSSANIPIDDQSAVSQLAVNRTNDEQEDVAPPLPKRMDSLPNNDLHSLPWYQHTLPREIALEILSKQEVGSFIVRQSSSHPSCHALSVKVPKYDNPSGISHYLIVPTPSGGVRLKGLDKEWPSLEALVTHHTVMQELLPCPLKLPRTCTNPAYREDNHYPSDLRAPIKNMKTS